MKSIILKVFGVTPQQYADLASLSASSLVKYLVKSRDLCSSGPEEKRFRLITLKNPKAGDVGIDDVPSLNLEIEISVFTYSKDGQRARTALEVLLEVTRALGIFLEPTPDADLPKGTIEPLDDGGD